MSLTLATSPDRAAARQVAPSLEIRGLKKSFGQAEIIRGVDLAVLRGERHALIGPNGAGKSTLFNLVSGLLRPSAGEIRLNGIAVTGMPAYEVNRRGLSRSFQVTNIFPKMTVWENVRCAVLWARGEKYAFWRAIEGNKPIAARTHEVLAEINLLSRKDIPAGVLTYAEQRALEIGVTIAGGADIILLDEPTAGMSHAETERAIELIRRISDGRTLLIVEHDMSVVFGLADRISVLVYGEIIASGTPDEIRANAKVREAYLGEDPT
jgi:branched-chain amino acid transport system ATP-binding protein